MGATMHHRASDFYFGHWPRLFAKESRIDSRSIAYNEFGLDAYQQAYPNHARWDQGDV
jgi:hypothetical protein